MQSYVTSAMSHFITDLTLRLQSDKKFHEDQSDPAVTRKENRKIDLLVE